MAKILQNLNQCILTGIVLLVIVIAVVAGSYGTGEGGLAFDHQWWATFVRYCHVLSGIMWIGLLYYFNFVQTPTMPKIPENLRPGVTGHILPSALFWFRWGAMSTIFFGLILAWLNGYIVDAISLGLTDHVAKHTQIGIGMWLGAIMWFNVWFVIWPNQKVVLGLSEGDKAKAGRTAGLFSRANTLLSIPMLWCMVSAQNLF